MKCYLSRINKLQIIIKLIVCRLIVIYYDQNDEQSEDKKYEVRIWLLENYKMQIFLVKDRTVEAKLYLLRKYRITLELLIAQWHWHWLALKDRPQLSSIISWLSDQLKHRVYWKPLSKKKPTDTLNISKILVFWH